MDCFRHGFQLNRPCSLEECPYHCSSDEYMNCLHQYVLVNGTDPLSPRETASILGLQVSEVQRSVRRSEDEMKVSKIDSVLGNGNEIEYVENCGICVTCGKKIEGSEGIRVFKDGSLMYCSDRCARKFPPAFVALVQRLGVDRRTVMAAVLDCMSGSAVCSLLRIDAQELEDIVKDLFGIEVLSVGSCASSPKEFVPRPARPSPLPRATECADSSLAACMVIQENL